MKCNLDYMDCGDNKYCLFYEDDDGNIDVESGGVCVMDPENENCDRFNNEAEKKQCQQDKKRELKRKQDNNKGVAEAKAFKALQIRKGAAESVTDLNCSNSKNDVNCNDGQGKCYNKICVPNGIQDADGYIRILNMRKDFNKNRFKDNDERKVYYTKLEKIEFNKTKDRIANEGIRLGVIGGRRRRKTRRLKKKVKKAKKTNRKIKKKKRRSIKRKRKRSKGRKKH